MKENTSANMEDFIGRISRFIEEGRNVVLNSKGKPIEKVNINALSIMENEEFLLSNAGYDARQQWRIQNKHKYTEYLPSLDTDVSLNWSLRVLEFVEKGPFKDSIYFNKLKKIVNTNAPQIDGIKKILVILQAMKTAIEKNNIKFNKMLLHNVAVCEDNEYEFKKLVYFIQKKLRSAVQGTPENEKNIQDTLETLLIGSNRQKGVDYDRESGKVKFSGKEYIPDFMMAKINTCIEIKFLSDKSNKSKIIEQITADIPAYKGKYSRQLFIVYDLAGGIQNENEFTCDLEKQGNIKVIVIKH